VFEQLYQVANEEIKELSALLKDYKNQNFTEKLSDAEESLIENKKKVTETQTLLDEYKERRIKVGLRIEELLGKLISVDSSVTDTDNLIKLKEELEESANTKATECNEYVDTLVDLESKLKKSQSEFDRYDLVDLKEKHLKYESYSKMMIDIQSQIDDLDREIEHKKKHLDGIGSLTFDDGCEHCVKNKNTPFAQQAQSLEREIKESSLIRLTRSGEYDEASINKAKYDVTSILAEIQTLKSEIDNYTNQIEKVELQTKSCNLELTELQNRIDKVDSDIQKSIEQKVSVEHNTKVQKEIDKYKENLKEIEDLIYDTNDILIDVSGEVKIAENTIKTVNDSINRLEDMETKYEGYEYYLQCVKRDGIPYELISDVLPKLEVEINNILQPLVDFQILLNTDGKNINSYIAYGEDEYWPLELTSGMEKFISSVAIRTALTNVSNLPRPNFIAIDEGFGSLDSDNFNSLYLLFDYLKNQFDFLVTISHIDKTRDMVDQIIDITKVGGFSSIRYL